MPQPILGILTLYLNHQRMEERSYFRKLIIAGRKLGLEVFVFTPEDVQAEKKRILAHCYDTAKQRWVRKWTAFPALIFDRCRFQATPRFKQLKLFRAKYKNLTYLNRTLANKWIIHQVLSKNSVIKPFLPESWIFSNPEELFTAMQRRKVWFLKPINGTGGRGILRIERSKEGMFLMQGRDEQRRIINPVRLTKSQLVVKLAPWNMKGRYLLQQGIDLKLANGRVHDYRLLIQRNGSGEWEVTGCAGRIGPDHSITSNLHGGGRAISMSRLLKAHFSSAEKIESIKKSAYKLAYDVVKELEEHYGRLCELALDIAIDRAGDVWLLEVNPKPSREVFSQINEPGVYQKAISRPLEYALWLYKKRQKEEH
ncbi:MAG TPA: YheC/YheD family protein [Bacilli bacterium]